MNYRRTFAVLLSPCLLAACANDGSELELAAPSEHGESTVVAEQRWTAGNPDVDTEYLMELYPPAGVSYLDIAVGGGRVYMSRSDGHIDYYTDSYPSYPYVGYLPNTYQHLEWVQSAYNWNLIASDDARRKIYYNTQNVPYLLGSYPAGVSSVFEIAAKSRNALELDIWVKHNGSAYGYIRHGVASKTLGRITWDSNYIGNSPYHHGFTYGSGPDGGWRIYSMLDYYSSAFVWYDIPSLNVSGEANFPYTEHAYLHPEGELDRFAPAGLAFSESDYYYYGIDPYYNASTQRHGWVFAAIYVSSLHP
jgi:hypothetical protein